MEGFERQAGSFSNQNSNKTNKQHTMSIFIFLLALPVILVVVLYGLIQWIEDKKLASIIDTKTNKKISRDRVIGIIPSLVTMIGEKHLHRSLKHLRDSKKFNFEPYITFLGVTPVINCPPLSDFQKIFTSYMDYPRLTAMNAFLSQLMGDSFVFQNGMEWKQHREMINHAFFDINTYIEDFGVKSRSALQLIDSNVKQSNKVHISSIAQKFTLDVLGSTMFGVQFNFLQGSDYNEYVDAYHQVLKRVNNNAALIFKGLYTNLPIESNRQMKHSLNVMDKYALKLVDEAKKRTLTVDSNSSHNSTMLDVLVGSNEFKENPLSDKAVKDDVALMFVAGHETSANALTFAFYALAKWPEVQKRVIEEVDSKIGRDKQELNRTDIDQLEYLSMFIYETLRMFPVIGIIIPRKVGKKSDVIADLKVKQGTFINICPMTTHHNPQIYEEPHVFDPERFTVENKKKRPSISFMPFGGGPRLCAGYNFAMIEMKYFLSLVLQKYTVSLPDPSYEMTIGGTGTITLPDPNFRVILTPRQ